MLLNVTVYSEDDKLTWQDLNCSVRVLPDMVIIKESDTLRLTPRETADGGSVSAYAKLEEKKLESIIKREKLENFGFTVHEFRCPSYAITRSFLADRIKQHQLKGGDRPLICISFE